MGFDTWQNKLKLTIDSSKIDEDLTNFPILVALSSGTGITNYDATDVFDQLEPNTISGVAVSGTYDDYTKLMLHMDGDFSDSQHTITMNGNPKLYATGIFNGSMYFDGAGDYLNIPDSSDFDLTSVFTIDFWFKTNTSNQCCLLNTGNANNSNEYQIEMNRTAGKLSVYSSGQKCVTASSWNDNNWHHCALVCDGTDMKMYIDGVKDGEELSYAPSWTPTGMYIGSAGGSEYYTGYIDELRISKGISRWTSNFTTPTEPYTTDSGTVLLLHMDGDQSESQHTVTFNGNPQLYATGKFNGSMYFDGTGDYLSLSDDSDWDFGTGDFTIDFWINPGVLPANYFELSGTATGDMFIGGRSGTVGIGRVNVAWDQEYVGGLSTTTWAHIAFVRFSGVLTIYVNGLSIGSDNNTNDYDFNSLYVGRQSGYYYTGYIDELRFSKGIARWTSNFIPPTGPYGSSWDNRKKIAVTTEVASPGIYDPMTKLLLHMDGDQSDSEHTVTFAGNAQSYSAIGKFDGSYKFDGAGDYLNLGSDSDWNFGSEEFTIDFWMYATSNADERDGLICVQNGSGDIEIHIGLGVASWGSAGDKICLSINYSGGWGADLVGSIGVCDSTWHHVAITKSGTSWKTYIDGVEDISTTYSFSPGAGTLLIGAHITTDRWFNGYLDEVRISKGVVRWDSSFTPPTEAYTTDSGTVLLLHMDGDQSRSEHSFMFNGNPQISSAEYKFNSSYYFDGSGDYLSIPSSTDFGFGTDDFTIECWTKFGGSQTNDSVICANWEETGGSWAANEWTLHNNHHVSGGYWSFWVYNINSSAEILVSTSASNDDTWTHVAVVRSGQNFYLFVNGVLEDSTSSNLSLDGGGSHPVYIGGDISTMYLTGYVEEFRISKGIARWTTTFSGLLPTDAYARSTGEVQLPVEIERWDSINEKAWLWTQVPTITSGTDTDLYLYYDKDQSDNTTYIGDTGEVASQNVWDNDFVGVWHMSQDPSGGLSTIKDSTSSVNDGTPAGSMTSTDLVDGKISKALDFDGSDDVITLGTITTAAWTAEIISKPINYTQSGDGFIVFDGNGIVQANGYWALLENSDCQRKGNSLSISGDFVNIVASYDGSSVYKMYENGVENSSSHVNSGWALGDKYYIAEGYSSRRPEGKIDEVRVSNTERSTAWVKSTYYSNWNNLITFSESSFVNFVFSNPVPADASTQYGYRHLLKITVTTSGNTAASYANDITFYDGSDNKIGNTVSGVSSGAQSTSTDYYLTPTAGTNSWYVYSTASGYDGTSSTYSFNNLFLCAGYTEVDGVRTSGIPVRLYKRSDGSMLGEAVTSGVSGTFVIPTSYTGYHYAVALHPTDDYRNAEIYDWLAPVVS